MQTNELIAIILGCLFTVFIGGMAIKLARTVEALDNESKISKY